MTLEKIDLLQIEKMFEKFEGRIHKQIKESESRVIAVISSEITDLAEINRAVINRIDKISELEKRIMRLEHKAGIVG